jgi:hypothetical protein
LNGHSSKVALDDVHLLTGLSFLPVTFWSGYKIVSSRRRILAKERCAMAKTESKEAEEGKMAEEKETKECKNPACSCKVPAGQKYCSASCEGAGQTIELDCDCSHAECRGNF